MIPEQVVRMLPARGPHQMQQQSSEASMLVEVTAVVEQMLGKVIDPSQPLMEAGLDSLGAVELRTALGQRFNQELPGTVTFDYPSAASLSRFLASQTSANFAVSLHCHLWSMIHLIVLMAFLLAACTSQCSVIDLR